MYLFAQQELNPNIWQILGILAIIAVVVFLLFVLFVFSRFFRWWMQSWMTGAEIGSGVSCDMLKLLPPLDTTTAGTHQRMLTRQQAAAYCGVSVPTFTLVCPISPVALGEGKRLERYDIRSLDAWLDKLGNDGTSLDKDWLAKWDSEHGGRSRERP